MSRSCCAALAAALLFVTAPSHPARADGKAEKLSKAFDEATEDSTSYKGLFHFRKKDGSLYAELGKSDLGKQFVALSTIAQGISAGDLLGGMMTWGDEWVLEFRRVDDQIQLVRKNIRFQAEKSTPIEEAVKISFSDSVIASLDIEGEKGGSVLVKLDSIFLSDLLDISSQLQGEFGSGYGLSKSLSSVTEVKAFPKNMEFETRLTFTGGTYKDLGTVPDSRYVTLTVHHSLVELPKDGYKPREADDRVGHFLTAHKDYSSTDIEGPFVRRIWRWHLEKADSKAKRSTVKNPIVFYLETTIPYAYRPYIRQGVLEWNKAFEKVGLVDAIEVRLQGEDADWDPEDVRYNTIRWITSPSTFAIGPSHVDPFTGQILDSDILIDASWINLWQREVQLLELSEEPEEAGRARDLRRHCAFTEGFRHQFALGALALLGEKGAKDEADKDPNGIPYWYVGAALKDLVMHEVGHTLGLRHNFKASSIRDVAALHDRALTEKEGLVGSVMDYLALNLAPEGTKQGEYHPSTLGPYDYWAIEYAYGTVSGDEAKGLSAIASKGTTAELAYASDEDNAAGIDPLVATWDIGADPLAYARGQLAHVKKLWDKVLDRVVPEGRSYARARGAVGSLLWEIQNGGMIAGRYIGGMYHHRDHKGDPGERPAFVPVPAKLQREALAFLGEGVFSDASYQLSPELLNHLAPSHWWHWGESPTLPRLDYDFHRRVQRIQVRVLSHVLDGSRLERMLDLERKVNPDEDLFTVPELLAGLTKMIFAELDKDPAKGKWSPRKPYVSSLRRNLQRSYVSYLSQLVLLVSARRPTDAALVARAELEALKKRLEGAAKKGGTRLDVYSRGHLADLAERIDQVLDARREVSGF